IRDRTVTGVQTCALPILKPPTFVGCAFPLALVIARTEPRTVVGWLRARLDPRMIALGIVPVAAASLWLAYGDSLKIGTPAAFLRSEERRVGKECRSPRST